jgi:hypothetical protein
MFGADIGNDRIGSMLTNHEMLRGEGVLLGGFNYRLELGVCYSDDFHRSKICPPDIYLQDLRQHLSFTSKPTNS